MQRNKTLGLIAMRQLLFADLRDLRRFDGLVAGTTFGVEESQEFLQNGGVGGVPQKGAFASDGDKFLVLELLQMMGQGGR